MTKRSAVACFKKLAANTKKYNDIKEKILQLTEDLEEVRRDKYLGEQVSFLHEGCPSMLTGTTCRASRATTPTGGVISTRAPIWLAVGVPTSSLAAP